MKNDNVQYFINSFVNHKEETVPIVICIVSQPIDSSENIMIACWEGDDIGDRLIRAVSAGVAIYNTEDTWDFEKAKEISYNKAVNSTPILYTSAGAIINEEVTKALADAMVNKLQNNPNQFIKGFSAMKKAFKAKSNTSKR